MVFVLTFGSFLFPPLIPKRNHSMRRAFIGRQEVIFCVQITFFAQKIGDESGLRAHAACSLDTYFVSCCSS
jgi:hypothetical protein